MSRPPIDQQIINLLDMYAAAPDKLSNEALQAIIRRAEDILQARGNERRKTVDIQDLLQSAMPPVVASSERNIEDLYRDVAPIQQQFDAAVNDYMSAYLMCLHALHYTDSPAWEEKLKLDRQIFNTTFDNLGDVVRQAKAAFRKIERDYGLNAVDDGGYDRFLNTMVDVGYELKDALQRAITGDASKLQALRKRQAGERLKRMIKEHQRRGDTMASLRDTRYQRQTVYIGLQANALATQGIQSTRGIISHIYKDLARRRDNLNDDEMTALEFFEVEYGLDTDEAWADSDVWRRLTTRISHYKRLMADEYQRRHG